MYAMVIAVVGALVMGQQGGAMTKGQVTQTELPPPGNMKSAKPAAKQPKPAAKQTANMPTVQSATPVPATPPAAPAPPPAQNPPPAAQPAPAPKPDVKPVETTAPAANPGAKEKKNTGNKRVAAFWFVLPGNL